MFVGWIGWATGRVVPLWGDVLSHYSYFVRSKGGVLECRKGAGPLVAVSYLNYLRWPSLR